MTAKSSIWSATVRMYASVWGPHTHTHTHTSHLMATVVYLCALGKMELAISDQMWGCSLDPCKVHVLPSRSFWSVSQDPELMIPADTMALVRLRLQQPPVEKDLLSQWCTHETCGIRWSRFTTTTTLQRKSVISRGNSSFAAKSRSGASFSTRRRSCSWSGSSNGTKMPTPMTYTIFQIQVPVEMIGHINSFERWQ